MVNKGGYMERFLNQINGQTKVPYESQIALWLYDCCCRQEQIQYEDSIISERLIGRFNEEMKI